MSSAASTPARRSPVLAVALGLVLAAVSWLRLDPTTRATVWAEDGYFLGERAAHGPFATLLDPYGGYLHLVPRLLVDLASLLPLTRYATTVTVLCCLTIGLVGALVLLCSGSVVSDVRARVALAAVPALVPVAPVEVLGNVANLHWYALWLTPWVLLALPARRWQAGALAVVVLLATLSEIQAALWLPLALLLVRERRRWPVLAAYAVGVGAQVAVTIASPRGGADGPAPGAVDLVKGFLLNVVLPLWHPSVDGAGASFATHGWWLAVALLAPFAVLALAAVRLRPPAVVVVTLVLGTVAPLVAGLVLNFQATYAYAGQSPAELADARPLRYGVVSGMFLMAGVVVAADRLLLGTRRWRVPVAALLVVGVLALGVVHLRVDTRRSHGPVWASGVAAAVVICRVSPDASVSIPIAPRRQGWQVTLACERVLGR